MTMDPSYNGPGLQARSATGGAATVAPRAERKEVLCEAEEPFVYGSRWVRVETPEGRTFREVPLTRADLFDPQEGDYVPHSIEHGDAISETKERLRCFFHAQGRDDVVVCDDVKMLWKDPRLHQVAPDLAVIPNVEDPRRSRRSFNEEQEGTGPVFVLEVTSEATASFDREDKPPIYLRAGIRECFLLDQLKSPWELRGWRLNPRTASYDEITPDEDGGLAAETLGVRFRIAPEGDDLIAEDVVSGELLRKPVEEAEARRAAEQRAAEEAEARRAAEQRAAELEARLERLQSSS